ncbi:RING finger protein 214 [Protopterus annectens]|uniref:RING finger protein 214 n=1 Tax=Protopterus annectens TaxID=7888 RepID=UPI001CF9DE7B|nr:RING finger protein 214 [Protopterus annectens]XP_043936896.1 RING finger protein 214 [Protopterus annectens]
MEETANSELRGVMPEELMTRSPTEMNSEFKMSTSADGSSCVLVSLPAEEDPPPVNQSTKPLEQTSDKDELPAIVSITNDLKSKENGQTCDSVTAVQVPETSPEWPESLQGDVDCSLYESDPEEYNYLMEDETLDQELEIRCGEMNQCSVDPAWNVDTQYQSNDTCVELKNLSPNKTPVDYPGWITDDCISRLADRYEMKECQPAKKGWCADDCAVEEENIYQAEICTADEIPNTPLVVPFQTVAVQTDPATADKEVSVDQDIVKHMEKVMSERTVLKEQYQELLDKQAQLENQIQVEVKQLQQKVEEEVQSYKETMKQLIELKQKRDDMKKKSEKDKHEFAQKERDLKVEIEKLYEKSKRLMKDQENKENNLASLIAEQNEEKEMWDAELAEMKKDDDDLRSKILEETERAMKAEVSSLEISRELASMTFAEVVHKAEQHVGTLQIYSRHPEMRQKRKEWERYLVNIRRNEENLLAQYNSHIQLVKNGAKLSSLPEIPSPILPPAPAEDFSAYSDILPVASVPTFPGTSSLDPSPGMSSYIPPASLSGSLPHSPPSATNPISASHKIPVPVRSPPGFEGVQEVPSSCPASKLDKLLKKLQDKFPHSSRTQLTSVLQQIKTARGTMAGLSMDELIQQVTIKLLSQPEQTAVEPKISSFPRTLRFPTAVSQSNPSVSRPYGSNAVMGHHPERPSVGPLGCKLCLVCQQVVQPNDLHNMACSHVVHKECIKFWAQANRNSVCPFCICSK